MAIFAPAESLPSPATLGDRRKSIPIMGIRQVSWELSFAFIMKPIKSIFDAIYMKGGNGSTRAINECGLHRKICKVSNRFTRFPKKILFGLELWAKEVQNAGSGTLPHRIAKDFLWSIYQIFGQLQRLQELYEQNKNCRIFYAYFLQMFLHEIRLIWKPWLNLKWVSY